MCHNCLKIYGSFDYCNYHQRLLKEVSLNCKGDWPGSCYHPGGDPGDNALLSSGAKMKTSLPCRIQTRPAASRPSLPGSQGRRFLLAAATVCKPPREAVKLPGTYHLPLRATSTEPSRPSRSNSGIASWKTRFLRKPPRTTSAHSDPQFGESACICLDYRVGCRPGS